MKSTQYRYNYLEYECNEKIILVQVVEIKVPEKVTFFKINVEVKMQVELSKFRFNKMFKI